MTKNQLLRKKKFTKLKKGCFYKKTPQKKFQVIKVVTLSPRKPNSANRKVAICVGSARVGKKIKKFNTRVYLAGIGKQDKINPGTVLLAKWGKTQDLVGVKYTLASYFKESFARKNNRSRHGIKKE